LESKADFVDLNSWTDNISELLIKRVMENEYQDLKIGIAARDTVFAQNNLDLIWVKHKTEPLSHQ